MTLIGKLWSQKWLESSNFAWNWLAEYAHLIIHLPLFTASSLGITRTVKRRPVLYNALHQGVSCPLSKCQRLQCTSIYINLCKNMRAIVWPLQNLYIFKIYESKWLEMCQNMDYLTYVYDHIFINLSVLMKPQQIIYQIDENGCANNINCFIFAKVEFAC